MSVPSWWSQCDCGSGMVAVSEYNSGPVICHECGTLFRLGKEQTVSEPREYVVAVADKMRADFNVFTEEALREVAARDPKNYRFDEASRSLVWLDQRPDFMVPDAEVVGGRFVVNRKMDFGEFFNRYITPQIPTEEPEP